MAVKINSRKMWAPLPQKNSAAHDVCAFAVRIQHLLETSSGTLMRAFSNKKSSFFQLQSRAGLHAASLEPGQCHHSHLAVSHHCTDLRLSLTHNWTWSKSLPCALNGFRNVPAQQKLDLSLLFWQQQFFIALKSDDFFFFASGTGIYNVLPHLSEFKLCII